MVSLPLLLGGNRPDTRQLDSVYDLHGLSTCSGVSGGALGYAGIDAVSVAGEDGLERLIGYQFTFGWGLGVDQHIVRQNTVPWDGKLW